MSINEVIGKAAIRLARRCLPTMQISVVDRQAGRNTYSDVGLRDAVRSGQFCNATGELFPGFPILSSDVVVDVGCGGGGNSFFCARFAAELIAVDIDPRAVATLAERLRAANIARYRVEVSDGNPLPIESQIADKVICTEVLEHVDDVKQFLRELVRIGKPGAQYLLSVPDPLSEIILMRVSPPSSYAKPNHIRIIERWRAGGSWQPASRQ